MRKKARGRNCGVSLTLAHGLFFGAWSARIRQPAAGSIRRARPTLVFAWAEVLVWPAWVETSLVCGCTNATGARALSRDRQCLANKPAVSFFAVGWVVGLVLMARGDRQNSRPDPTTPRLSHRRLLALPPCCLAGSSVDGHVGSVVFSSTASTDVRWAAATLLFARGV